MEAGRELDNVNLKEIRKNMIYKFFVNSEALTKEKILFYE